ncbi:tRNA (N6-isopentenyl adenosine(37)-C2)-methylthiotransferase MiaB [Thermophilibacter immobilis]|uniref:tRNA-2-methylthio-N(6)-dimethylallyladenosine synthase n=1 Tax=Thermophilibacter immobilis TaxID=2779519 RepID=A0A7S7RVB2_9ACTN|nr:tRNA (N6-isopentenyl adenosine(37)-C2)-methylthiotransferase MiaB [Thermophilibacter immobilis]QOY61485.1 tRNA (N6-isopentenyl adenosine(37)-C2)-methylthiotransferase MiaB [Thermophilibacter immobilis]
MDRPSALVGKTYWVKTFGCQMNLHDSERVSGLLDECGCISVSDSDEADVVVFMTCCVRENADQRLYGQASAMVSAPTPPSGRRVVAIGGCIAQRDGERIRAHIPVADVVFGTSALASLPDLLAEAFAEDGHEVEVDTIEKGRPFSTDLPSRRAQSFHAWVPIMTGCNNFCSFCIVPYVRGREKSRTMESVVAECERLVADGVREVTLLGQNVNSYGRSLYGEPHFAELLRRVGATGIERIRFTSSNPKDLSDETIRAMAEVDAVMPHLHLAVQSGSDRVLHAMRRAYTREEYLALVGRLNAGVDGLALSTDVIVGFPGETEADFEDTLSLVREAAFSSAYTFIYSPRPGTPAARIADDTPHEVIQERFDRLAQQVALQARDANQADLNGVVSVLVEGASKKGDDVVVGHSEKNQTVHLHLPAHEGAGNLVGKICDVHVDEARTWYLRGTLVGDPR